MSKRLLIIWTARSIPTCQHHFKELKNTDKVWVRGHNEVEVADWITNHQNDFKAYTTISLCPDDVILTQATYDLITTTCTQNPEHAASGWANVDFTQSLATVMLEPVPKKLSSDWFTFKTIAEVAGQTQLIQATWSGMCCHTMTPALWNQHPILPHNREDGGCASDHALAVSLQAAGRKILIDSRAAMMHLKEDHTLSDTTQSWKRLDLQNKHIEWERL